MQLSPAPALELLTLSQPQCSDRLATCLTHDTPQIALTSVSDRVATRSSLLLASCGACSLPLLRPLLTCQLREVNNAVCTLL